MPIFKIVNPHIEGTFNTEINASSSHDAAEQFWVQLSKHITNDTPRFAFTLQSGEGDFNHYMVREKKNADEVSYVIDSLAIKNEKALNEFKNKLKTFETMEGGKHHHKKSKKSKKSKKYDDSSSSDFEEDDYFERYYRNAFKPTQVVSYWWYTPYIYGLKDIFIPTFKLPLLPYVNIWTPFSLYTEKSVKTD